MTQSSSRPPASVEDLIAAIRAGFQAYQELYARYHPYLARLTERLISPELQTDLGTSGVVQEGFLKIWQSFPSFRGSTEAELRAWMRAILRNTLTSEQRRLEAGRRDRGRRQ
ncbi:MAG TPA: sigma factor, partial [Gemmataceae bacterium]|nr:sigma factor [Gemmataceae bacterium]